MGIGTFPNMPAVIIIYSNFLIDCKKDGQNARTQLQLAAKNSPSRLVSRHPY